MFICGKKFKTVFIGKKRRKEKLKTCFFLSLFSFFFFLYWVCFLLIDAIFHLITQSWLGYLFFPFLFWISLQTFFQSNKTNGLCDWKRHLQKPGKTILEISKLWFNEMSRKTVRMNNGKHRMKSRLTKMQKLIGQTWDQSCEYSCFALSDLKNI